MESESENLIKVMILELESKIENHIYQFGKKPRLSGEVLKKLEYLHAGCTNEFLVVFFFLIIGNLQTSRLVELRK